MCAKPQMPRLAVRLALRHDDEQSDGYSDTDAAGRGDDALSREDLFDREPSW